MNKNIRDSYSFGRNTYDYDKFINEYFEGVVYYNDYIKGKTRRESTLIGFLMNIGTQFAPEILGVNLRKTQDGEYRVYFENEALDLAKYKDLNIARYALESEMLSTYYNAIEEIPERESFILFAKREDAIKDLRDYQSRRATR